MKKIGGSLLLLIIIYTTLTFESGCAQIGSPTGGPIDSVAPVLIKETPVNRTTNFTGNKIVLDFDEYVEVQDIQENVLVSPFQKKNPLITYNFKTVTIRLRDTLLPNTTYSINFGNAIKDLNEGNPLKDFTYLFSTGSTIDSLQISGKVLMAETGNPDSTLMVMLYRDATDSSVIKNKPNYIAKIKGDGSFRFTHLPQGSFSVYALKDGDGGRTYNSKVEPFAFLDAPVNASEDTSGVTLYAYQEQKAKTATSSKAVVEKTLKYTTEANGGQDILSPLTLTFNNSIKKFDQSKVLLTDTAFRPVRNTTFTFDSTRKLLTLQTAWQQSTDYILLLPHDAITDSADHNLTGPDTLRFSTRRNEDYGSVILRFKNLDLSRKPVLQFVKNDIVAYSYPLSVAQWSSKVFNPGEYDIRILYDTNNNGIWDPGNFSKKLQPEIAVTLPQKLTVRPNWDNERDINL